MRFTLTIDCDNAAFGDDAHREVARILRAAAEQVGDYETFILRDANGNTVGEFAWGEVEA